MSFSAALLVIVVISVRFFAIDRLPKTMFLALWGLALFRLLVPVSIPLPAGISSFINRLPIPSLFVNSSSSEPVALINIPPGVNHVVQPVFQTDILPIIWICGMIILFVIFVALYLRTHRKLKFATDIRDNDFINSWLADHKHIRPVTVLRSDRISSPLAVGIIKPRIILPASLELTDTRRLDFILTHEYFHIKRFDALWKLLLIIVICIHWYNPVVWIMFILANRDLELTCDHMVLRHFSTDVKSEYAFMLINMIQRKNDLQPIHSGFNINCNQERIISIMKNKKPSIFNIIPAVLIVTVLTFGVLMTTACDEDPAPEASALPRNFTAIGSGYNGSAVKDIVNDKEDEETEKLLREAIKVEEQRVKSEIEALEKQLQREIDEAKRKLIEETQKNP